MRTSVTVSITVAVTLAVAAVVGCFIIATLLATKDEPAEVRVEAPSRGELVETVSAPGEVRPKTSVSIRAGLSAMIVELPHEEGDRVKKGDLLVRLKATGIEAAVRTGMTRLGANAREATTSQGSDKLARTTITSPIDGVVTRVYAEVGETVVADPINNPGAVIMEVADLSKMMVVAGVDEWDVGKVKAGQTAMVRIRAYPDEEFQGVVDFVALKGLGRPGAAMTFRVKILLDCGGRPIYSGLTADVEIETRRHQDVLRIPSQAVLGRKVGDLPSDMRDGNPNVDKDKAVATVVYRCKQGKAVVTPVTVGPSDATHTAIRSGLSETDSVIVGPYKILEKLEHDQEVRGEATSPTTQPGEPTKSGTPAARSGPTGHVALAGARQY